MARAQQGFTLLEMLVVMVLLGLMTGLALPAMQRWHDAVQRRAQAGLVVDLLRAAAFRAAASRRDIVVDATSFEAVPAPSVPAATASSSPPGADARPLGDASTERQRAEPPGAAPMAPQGTGRLSVSLASGWSAEEIVPLRFLASGLCTPGGFTLKPPSGSALAVRVDGPVCKVALLAP